VSCTEYRKIRAYSASRKLQAGAPSTRDSWEIGPSPRKWGRISHGSMIMQVSGVITGNVIALPPHFSVPVAVNTCRLKFQTPVPRLARRVDTSSTAERYCNFFWLKGSTLPPILCRSKGRKCVCSLALAASLMHRCLFFRVKH
jgi:hypothetical protein